MLSGSCRAKVANAANMNNKINHTIKKMSRSLNIACIIEMKGPKVSVSLNIKNTLSQKIAPIQAIKSINDHPYFLFTSTWSAKLLSNVFAACSPGISICPQFCLTAIQIITPIVMRKSKKSTFLKIS